MVSAILNYIGCLGKYNNLYDHELMDVYGNVWRIKKKDLPEFINGIVMFGYNDYAKIILDVIPAKTKTKEFYEGVLECATTGGNLEMVKYILGCRKKIDKQYSIQLAIKWDYPIIMDMLVDSNISTHILYSISIRHNNFDMISHIENNYKIPNSVYTYNIYDSVISGSADIMRHVFNRVANKDDIIMNLYEFAHFYFYIILRPLEVEPDGYDFLMDYMDANFGGHSLLEFIKNSIAKKM